MCVSLNAHTQLHILLSPITLYNFNFLLQVKRYSKGVTLIIYSLSLSLILFLIHNSPYHSSFSLSSGKYVTVSDNINTTAPLCYCPAPYTENNYTVHCVLCKALLTIDLLCCKCYNPRNIVD